MASESTTPARPLAADLPVIENEVPAYRALSRAAIASLVFGMASIFSFVSIYFVALGVLAIAFGVAAQRNIRRLPDVLTGSRMANAGTGLGLMFSLAALTIAGVQLWIVDRDSARFMREYVDALKSGVVDRPLYFENHPEGRKGKSPEEMAKSVRDSMRAQSMFDSQTQPIRDIQRRLASSPGQTIEVARRIGYEVSGMDVYTKYLLTLKGPKNQDFPEETQYATVVLQGFPHGRTYAWQVRGIKFPVTQDEFRPTAVTGGTD